MAHFNTQTVQYDDASGELRIAADKLKLGGNIVGGKSVSSGVIDATYDGDRFIFTADRAYQVTSVDFMQSVIEATSSTTTVMVKKVPSGTVIGSGSDVLAAALNLKTGVTANTKQSVALNATTGNLQLAAGDSLALDFTNALTEYIGSCTITLKPI
jgi:hypothetical protein